MNESQRRDLLNRIRRTNGTVGTEIPEEITVQGETIDLRAFIFECKRLDSVSEADRARIEEVKTDLKRERLERKQRIEGGAISYEEGDRLVRSIGGIDRALNALEGIEQPDLGEQLREKQLEDARQLLALLGRR